MLLKELIRMRMGCEARRPLRVKWLRAVVVLASSVVVLHSDARIAIFADDAVQTPATPLLPERALMQIGWPQFRHQEHVSSVAYSTDGKLLATTTWNTLHPTVNLWNTKSGQLVKRLIADGEKGFANCVAFAPNADKLAFGDAQGNLYVLEVAGGKLIFSGQKHKSQIRRVTFTPSGHEIVTGGQDGVVCVSDAANPGLIDRTWSLAPGIPSGAATAATVEVGDGDGINALAASADGKKIAAATGNPATIMVWDAINGNVIAQIERAHGQGDGEVSNPLLNTLQFTPDSKQLISAGNRVMKRESTSLKFGATNVEVLEIKLWDVSSGNLVREIATEEVFGRGELALSHDGKLLATSDNGAVHFWKFDGHKPFRSISTVGVYSSPLCFAPDDAELAASTENSVSVWDVAAGTSRFDGENTGDVRSAAWNSAGTKIVVGYLNGARLWDAASGKLEHTLSMGEPLGPGSWTAVAWAVGFTPDGQTVLTAGSRDDAKQYRTGNVRFWEAASGKLLGEIDTGREARDMAISPDGTKFVVGTTDWTQLIVYDLAERKELARLPQENDGRRGLQPLKALAFSPDSQSIEVALSDGNAFRWNIQTGIRDREFTADWRNQSQRLENKPRLWIGAAVFAPDGNTLITSTDETLAFWDTQTGQVRRQIQVPEAPHGFKLGIALDGKTIVGSEVNYVNESSTDDIRLWDVATGEERLVLKPNDARASAFAFSPDGRKLLTGFYNGTAMIWNVSSR
jgi:WD40 repeat protein